MVVSNAMNLAARLLTINHDEITQGDVMSIAKIKYDAHLKWLRNLADSENLQFIDVLRAVCKDPESKYRLADLASPEFAENRLIELGRVGYYEGIIEEIIKTTDSDIEKMAENRLSKMRSKASKHAADTQHSKPGGSRELRNKITMVWASGKYADRDKCADQEFEGLGFGSFKTARNALKGTPDPAPWPAKKQKKK